MRLKKARPRSSDSQNNKAREETFNHFEQGANGIAAFALPVSQAALDGMEDRKSELRHVSYRGIPPRVGPPEVVFRRAGQDWEAWVEHEGYRVQVLAEDDGGHPSCDFVTQVERIVQELAILESIARVGEPELAMRLTPDHRLALVSETHPKADFALGFAGPAETVIVDFKNGNVFSWCFLQEPESALTGSR